jgi:hypothetical protein
MTRYAKSHTHRLQSSLIHQNKVAMRPYLHDEICKITHTLILLADHRSCCTCSLNKLHLCWWLRELIPGLQWDHKAFWTCTFGLQEHSASGGRKHRKKWSLDTAWRIVHPENNDHWTQDEIVHPNAMRFWATFPGHGCEQGVCHKDSSRSCVRGMSNPITPITRILLATERSRRRRRKR